MGVKEERPVCPECGEILSLTTYKDKKTGEMSLEFFCEGAGDDSFSFEILTGLNDEGLKKLTQVGKLIHKEMKIRLLERKPEP